MRRILGSALCLAAMGCGGGQSETDSPSAEQRELDKIKSVPLQVDVLAGQEISVLPITLVVPDSSLSAGGLFQQRDVRFSGQGFHHPCLSRSGGVHLITIQRNRNRAGFRGSADTELHDEHARKNNPNTHPHFFVTGVYQPVKQHCAPP